MCFIQGSTDAEQSAAGAQETSGHICYIQGSKDTAQVAAGV